MFDLYVSGAWHRTGPGWATGVDASANDVDLDAWVHHLPDTKQEVELHLSLLVVQRVRECDLEEVAPLDPLTQALAPPQESEQVVCQFFVAKPQSDSHGRR
jgi:hypothetical protein